MDRPNILIIMVDEWRYPTVYDGEALERWRKQHLKALNVLKSRGLEFTRHYCGSLACAPSRATFFTGHYPSLHGVTQTTGAAKDTYEDDVFWLDRNAVPTLGHYFQEAGYDTYYKGKWHISHEDLMVPGTHDSLPRFKAATGMPDTSLEAMYLRADRLEGYGFKGWVGPEPHGMDPQNSGSSATGSISGRDEIYAKETVELIHALDKRPSDHAKPWLMVASFVNPHDISLYGALAERSSGFKFDIDDDVPDIDPPPTLTESLHTKPSCQADYRKKYPQAFQPITNQAFYRRLYYQLQKNVDQQISKVLDALMHSSMYEQTIVLFTSDHGDLLGAHGNLHQKWYCAYEEAIHVPLIVHSPRLFKRHTTVDMLTSHVDIVPTLLGIAGIDEREAQRRMKARFSDVRPLVGRDLSQLLTDQGTPKLAEEPIYFMCDDDVTKGRQQVSLAGQPYAAVAQPNHVETVIAKVAKEGTNQTHIWKYTRYFDNPQFWDDDAGGREPEPDQFELYNLTEDPLETINYAHPTCATAASKVYQRLMAGLLDEQRRKKRLTPQTAEN